MGYVHDTGFTQWIPPTVMHGDTAAWAMAAGQVSGSLVFACDATDEVANLWIPILLPSNSDANKGCMLKSIEVDYEIIAAACDAVTVNLYKMTRGADGADVTVTDVTGITFDAAHDTDDERDDLDEHAMTVTLDTPDYIDNGDYYYLKIAFDKAASSTVEILGAFANFTFRA